MMSEIPIERGRLLSTTQAAQRLKVSRWTVRRWLIAEKGLGVRIGDRWFVAAKDLGRLGDLLTPRR
jgi:excisionase family DNA binding protein